MNTSVNNLILKLYTVGRVLCAKWAKTRAGAAERIASFAEKHGLDSFLFPFVILRDDVQGGVAMKCANLPLDLSDGFRNILCYIV